jgi:hypothetical protein
LDGVHGSDKDPNLNHVAGFPVVAWRLEARRDDHAGRVFVENKSVHAIPPTISSAKQSAKDPRTRAQAARKASARNRFLRDFMVFDGSDLWEHGGIKPKETHLVNTRQQKDCASPDWHAKRGDG